jgi:hypothetical protein
MREKWVREDARLTDQRMAVWGCVKVRRTDRRLTALRPEARPEKNPQYAYPASIGGRIDGIEPTQTGNKPHVNF